MNIIEQIEMVLNEKATSQSTQMICRECGKKFKKKMGPKTFEAKCPKCGGFDTDVDESTCTGDIAQNKARGHIKVIGMKYRKRKRKSKLTGRPIVIHENENE